MEITTIDPRPSSSVVYSVFTDGLDIGSEIDWDPEHLALSAWLEHVPFAFWLMKVLRPACFVELGTERGISYAAFCQAADRLGTGSRCYAIDTWRGDEHAGLYDESVYLRLAEVNDRKYRRFSSLLRTTFAEALPYFADGEIDLLHIDGLHTYEAVSEDFKTWRPKLSDRAVVVFHDTNVRRDDFGVWRLWRELSAEFPHFEFVHGHGLGIIGVGEHLPPAVRALFSTSAHNDLAMSVRALFGARGTAVQRAYDLQNTMERIQSLSAEVAAHENTASDLQQEAATLRQDLFNAQEYVKAQQAHLDAAQATAAAEQSAAAAAQAEIDALRQQMDAGLAAAEAMRQEIAATAAEVSSANRRLIAEKAGVAADKDQLARENARLAEDLAAEHENVARLVGHIAGLNGHGVDLRQQLGNAQERCAALEASTSWRITAPIRSLKIALAGHPAKPRQQANGDGAALDQLPPPPPQADVLPPPPPRQRTLPPLSHLALLRLRVLIVAEVSLPQCKKYRVDQKHDMIESLGWDCTVVNWHDTDKILTLLQTHSVVIFYRVPAFPDVLRVIKETEDLGLPHYFELDDLIFDLNDYAANANLIGLDTETTRGLFEGAALYGKTLSLCRNIVASTPYLAERMQAVGGGSSFVVENALDAETLKAAAAAKRRASDGKVRIVYGSGTRTHDADFAVVADALKRVLTENQNLELLLVGELSPPPGLLAFGGRLKRLPACPYPQYLALLAGCDIAIAPLIAANFNDAKSNIKFLEAAAMGVPSVCSPRSAFANAIQQGQTGFLADTTEEWHASLTTLIADAALRLSMGEKARRDVLERYSPDAIAHRQVEPMLATYQPPRDTRLHVLQVNILCKPQTFGGATVVMEEMTRRLNRRADTRVSVFTSAPAGWIEPYALERGEVDGVPVFRIGIQDRPGWLGEAWDETAAEVFRDVLRALRPDVVQFHSMQGIGAATFMVCKEEGIPFVVTLHDAWWLCERQFLVTGEGKYCGQTRIDMNVCSTCVTNIGVTVPRNLRLRQALDAADLLIAPSQHWRRFYIANRFAPDRVVVNENGIPLPANPKPNKGHSPLRFGFVAGAEAVKGFTVLKRTFEALQRSDWELVLVNHGLAMGVDSYQGITWQAEGTITTVPPFKEAERDSFYDSIDVLLFPSQWPESFGLTVREALARNKWVISTNKGGAAEAIRPGINGTLIPMSDDIAPFRKAVEDLLDRQSDMVDWVNPASDQIRDFATQAQELRSILASVAAHAATRAPTSEAAD